MVLDYALPRLHLLTEEHPQNSIFRAAPHKLANYLGNLKLSFHLVPRDVLSTIFQCFHSLFAQEFQFLFIAELQLMFRLLDRVPNGIEPILRNLEDHIVHAGLADMVASADIITQVGCVHRVHRVVM